MKSSTFETELLYSRNSHVGHSNRIHGSTLMRYDLFTPFHLRSFDFNLGSLNVFDIERETCVKKASSTLFNLVRGWMSSCARFCSGRFLLWLCHINISLNILAQPRMLLKKLRWFLTKLFGTNKLETWPMRKNAGHGFNIVYHRRKLDSENMHQENACNHGY